MILFVPTRCTQRKLFMENKLKGSGECEQAIVVDKTFCRGHSYTAYGRTFEG